MAGKKNMFPKAIKLYVVFRSLLSIGKKWTYYRTNYWNRFWNIVEVEEITPGDADGDGKVDVNDVTSTINHILNKPVATFIEKAADMDQDGKIDVNDVQAIIYKALGK